MLEALVLWVAVAITPSGPALGRFESEAECREAVAAAREHLHVSDCQPVTFKNLRMKPNA